MAEQRLVVNLETCGRTGTCIFRFPAIFRENEDGFPVIQPENAAGLSAQEVEDIIQSCPTGSISAKDEGEG